MKNNAESHDGTERTNVDINKIISSKKFRKN